MNKLLRTYHVIVSINPATKEQEFIRQGEWGDWWSTGIQYAKKYDELSSTVPDDGMAPKGSLVIGRTLEIWTIQEIVVEVLTVDQRAQKNKEEQINQLLEERRKIEEQLNKIRKS